MNIRLLLDTVVHLRPVQVYYQVVNRLVKKTYVSLHFEGQACVRPWRAEPVPRPVSLAGDTFRFLNLEKEAPAWGFAAYGPLWNYNLNYFDFLNQEGMTEDEGGRLIDRFVAEQVDNPMGLDPYPTALRGINWVKFFCRYPAAFTPRRADVLYSHYRRLLARPEYHLLANHLLEDFYALLILSLFFGEADVYRRVAHRLLRQLDEQTLPDGAHYEQSPMYHCILLDRLLDCINYAVSCGADDAVCGGLRGYAALMLGHLQALVWADGSIPLLNDAACGIAPTPPQLFAYARRLGLTWSAVAPGASGYRRMAVAGREAVVDVGRVAAAYQPGHTHADTFSYELRKDGHPFVVDTGVSTYDKTPRRQYERGTAAHNTVTIGGEDSSEVWGGFRVGRRATVRLVHDEPNHVEARCRTARGRCHGRLFELQPDGRFEVTDTVRGGHEAVSRIHLAPGLAVEERRDEGEAVWLRTSLGTVCIEGAARVAVVPCRVAREYNRLEDALCIEMTFRNHLKYTIQ